MVNNKVIAFAEDALPAADRPRFALVSSAAWEDPCSPEIEMTVNTAFFPDRESAVRIMALELCDVLDDEQREDWDECGCDTKIGKPGFSINGDCYRINVRGGWYSVEGDPDDPGAFKKTWRIVEIPSLV